MTVGFVVVFSILALVAVFGAWRMISSHHPIHSALYLVLTLCASAGIYLLLGAPFIAIVQVAVYAGAIMVLFLFVVMYLNLGLARDIGPTKLRGTTAVLTATVLAAMLLAGGAVGWSGKLAGMTRSEVAAGRQAAAEGRLSVPGQAAGTAENEDLLRVGRATNESGMTSVEDIGTALFSGYALPFELASLLLLAAMIGTLVIARPLLQREQAAGEEGTG